VDTVAVNPATTDRFDDVVAVLGCAPSSPCCCQYWRMSSGDYGRSSLDARRAALRARTRETPPPGMLAYVDDEPAGWCGIGVRQRMERLDGVPALEAYPVHPGGARIHGSAAYVGTTGMLEAAGFRRVLETDARSARLPRWLMRLELRA
jgi:hypothetical protein